jgi:hypothetical protein
MDPYTIQYEIFSEEVGDNVVLKIWESLEDGGQMRTSPFLYILNYRLSSKELAWYILNDYLKVAGAKGLAYHKMSDRGSIRIENHPTIALAW